MGYTGGQYAIWLRLCLSLRILEIEGWLVGWGPRWTKAVEERVVCEVWGLGSRTQDAVGFGLEVWVWGSGFGI